MTKCIVKNCQSDSSRDCDATFHSFPSSIHWIKLWLQQTGNTSTDVDILAQDVLQSKRPGAYQICSKHFSPKNYMFSGTKMILKPDAVPMVYRDVPNISEVQDVSKAPSCTKAQVENGSSSLPRSYPLAFPPQMGPTLKGLIQGSPEISEPGDMIHDLTLTTKLMVDKSIGTDLHGDFVENKSEKVMNKRLLKLAMEIISLLTGEEYVMVKKNPSRPSSPHNGEVPIKFGDVSVYFTMEEWDYIEEHRDLYQKVVTENPISSSPVPEEPEMCMGNVKAVLVTEEEDGDQSGAETEQVDASSSVYAGEFSTDSPSVGQAVEETYVLNSWETSVVQEATCTEDDLQEDSYTLPSSSGSMAKHNAASFHGSQLEDSGEHFPIASPRHAMESLAYMSTSEQCEEQAWTAYSRYVGDSSFTSTEHPQIKEETNQYNYMYDEDASYGDHNPVSVCEEQNQLFETMNNLLMHQMTHGQSSSVDKPYACNHCDKRFAKRSHLGMHLKTHTGEKPYACPDCGKRFSRRSNMATHYRTHTGEKPFACPKCGKRFTQSSHMVTHQRTHSTDKLFTCPECKKCFTKWSYLNFHLRTHGIEKLSVP
ncbi:zinc finger protein 436-like [Bufo gargarizans]|uniref:zinc finger protein 436-like n=1 Tax=Bufo gargarizans TaxID=30331 RepID=UPI001CF589C6|nr:zinc finger protein 436-like [Bufo gargarizans]